MATTDNLGRVQGASIFTTTQSSSTSVTKSTLKPTSINPLVGDAVLFPNGDLRAITAVAASTITCGSVIASLKGATGDTGDDGIVSFSSSGSGTAVTDVAYNTSTKAFTVTKGTPYTLPTASSSTLGGVKTTSTVTSTSGLTACPIISGVPYYKDTNTTYSLSSFGVTATAAELNKLDGVTATTAELNYIDGVTSNIQTQLNDKVSKSNTGVQSVAGGLVVGGTSATATGKGRIMLTGNTNPLIGLQAIDSSGNQLTPYYFQVTNDKMYLGPTSSKALAFDSSGNTTIPASLTVSGTITENGTALSNKYQAKGTYAGTSTATTSAAGLMSASDKSKLDGIASGANNYSLPTASSSTLGGVKTGSNITNSSGTISLTKANVTSALGYTPPTTNTTYSAATTSTAGLMSAADKTKLDGIATGANAYSLPTASSSTLGGVKTTSTVTSTSGLTACPIISGVPYYKDTNTTYSLSSFGVTATAAELNKLDGVTATTTEINKLDGLTATTTELNYVDGVTSNIQTQLNAKAPTSHASSTTTYGVGTTSNYGHVKISNGDVGTTASANGLAAGMDHTHSELAAKSEGIFYIEGTGTTDSTAKTSTWTGTSDRITSYYDGLTIRYKIGVAGQSTVTLNINSLGAKTVYRFNTTKLTTHFPVGSIITLIYHEDLNDGCWVTNDYDSNTNTYQRVYPTTTNAEYPITARYATTTGKSYYAEYGRYSTGVTLNPSTNTITASTFKGALSGNATSATTATKATQDGSGNVITSTYATKSEIPTFSYSNGVLTITSA